MGEGLIEDVTVHPATRAMVDELAAWYDRHCDPEWRDILLAPPDAEGNRAPWAYALRRAPRICAPWVDASPRPLS